MHCTAMQLIERLGPRLFFKKFQDRDNAITSFAFQVKIPACFLNLRPLIWMSLTLWSNFTTKSVLSKFISNCMPVLLVHLSVYLSVSVSVSPSMVYDSMSSCKSKNVEKEVFTSDPLACLSIVQNQIKHRTPLQSSKFKAS